MIRDGNSSETLENVSVLLKGSGKGSIHDARGKVVVKNIPAGRQVLIFSISGYNEQLLEVIFPVTPADSVFIITHFHHFIPYQRQVSSLRLSLQPYGTTFKTN